MALYRGSTSAPVSRSFDITPDDDTDLSIIPRALHIGNGGDVVVVFADDDDDDNRTLFNLISGACYSYRVKRVLATGTDATSIVGLY